MPDTYCSTISSGSLFYQSLYLLPGYLCAAYVEDLSIEISCWSGVSQHAVFFKC